MSDKRQYFRVEEYGEKIAWPVSSKGWKDVRKWRIVSIAGNDIVATGIPTKEYAEACRQALEKELSK